MCPASCAAITIMLYSQRPVALGDDRMAMIADLATNLYDLQFVAALHAVAQKAQAALPRVGVSRIEKAAQIVLSSGATLLSDGHAVVVSQSRPDATYSGPVVDVHREMHAREQHLARRHAPFCERA